MTEKRNTLYLSLRAHHVPRMIAYRLTVFIIKR